ncbi:MAG: tRNA (adenosine(37)-N6)-threonylcarbamoyltransferase complex dimerization subunit type 1 TsaB [Bacteroidota bacterium]|nr:tRNA (adenosine(37)-N6)-threonylcarbamoyltransferase complex dimerization subunit type 1 TsaB [Bacteroidota bacterium]
MANILCIETSGNFCTVALLKNNQTNSLQDEKVFAHAEVLASLIQALMEQTQTAFSELNAIAVSEGPGSYTGLRIGVSTAKGLCVSLNIPLIAISSLLILAKATKSSIDSDFYWAMIDARRMEVYQGLFDKELNLVNDITPMILTEDNFQIKELIQSKNIVLCGDGASKASEILKLKNCSAVIHAKFMTAIAEKKFIENDFVDLASYEPFYLKSANITIAKKKALG